MATEWDEPKFSGMEGNLLIPIEQLPWSGIKNIEAIFCEYHGQCMTMETAKMVTQIVPLLIVNIITSYHKSIGGQICAICFFVCVYLNFSQVG